MRTKPELDDAKANEGKKVMKIQNCRICQREREIGLLVLLTAFQKMPPHMKKTMAVIVLWHMAEEDNNGENGVRFCPEFFSFVSQNCFLLFFGYLFPFKKEKW